MVRSFEQLSTSEGNNSILIGIPSDSGFAFCGPWDVARSGRVNRFFLCHASGQSHWYFWQTTNHGAACTSHSVPNTSVKFPEVVTGTQVKLLALGCAKRDTDRSRSRFSHFRSVSEVVNRALLLGIQGRNELRPEFRITVWQRTVADALAERDRRRCSAVLQRGQTGQG